MVQKCLEFLGFTMREYHRHIQRKEKNHGHTRVASESPQSQHSNLRKF